MLQVCFTADIPRGFVLDDDLAARTYIRGDLLEPELTLFATKWFDYRHLTPLQATRLYMDALGEVTREVCAAQFDREAAKHIRVIDAESVLGDLSQGSEPKALKRAKSRLTSCWRGRQTADALGMPYRTYIELAFEFRLRFWNQRHLPQPQHLYNDMDVEKIAERWQELQEAGLYVSGHPAYLLQNYVSASHQDDHHEWLFTQAGRRSDPAELLARFVNEDLLPLTKVKTRLDEYTVARVHQFLN